MSQAQSTPPLGSRISEQENEIPITTIRDFLKRVLADDAVADQVNELLFDHVVLGRLHPSVVAASLVGPDRRAASGGDHRGLAGGRRRSDRRGSGASRRERSGPWGRCRSMSGEEISIRVVPDSGMPPVRAGATADAVAESEVSRPPTTGRTRFPTRATARWATAGSAGSAAHSQAG